MRYWDGVKKTSKTSTFGSKLDDILSLSEMETSLFNYSASKPGPSRKLSIENEFFFTLIKLRLDLLQQDLAIRFDISTDKVSQIFITWIQLLSHQVGVLIIWPSR